MAKRGLSLLLALVTVFSLTAPAFAEEAPVEEPEEVTEEVENKPVTAATSGTCGEGVTYTLTNDGTVTISGNGKIDAFAFENRRDIETVVINSGVTGIGGYAFSGCTSLTRVTIPGSVGSIEDGAFSHCPSLASVKINNGVTTIMIFAFLWCDALTSVTIPESVTSIGESAFGLCDSLTDVTVLNPDCEIYYRSDTLGVQDGVTTIHGYTGSTAAAYAKAYGYPFVALDAAPTVTPTPKPTATPVPTLAAPTVEIAQTSDGIQVSWNKVAGSPRYMVYYKEGSGSWKKIGTTTSTTYTRKAAQLKNGVTYTFTVRCCENDKKTLLGPYKASNSLKYTAQLAAPTVKIAKVAGGIKVSWNKITGSPRYMVYYKENGGSWKRIGTTTATTYTRAAKYLKNGATYQFTVRCCENDKKTLLGPYKASNSLKYTK